MSEALDAAIDKAMGDETPDKVETPLTPPKVDKVEAPEDGEEAEVEIEEKEKPAETIDEEAAEREEALNLYRSLKNPAQAKLIVEELANRLGLENLTTKKEVTVAKKQITDVLKDALGEFGFLADKLGPAMEKILEEERKEITSRLDAQEASKIEVTVKRTFADIDRKTNGDCTKLGKEIEKLAKEFPPSKTTDPKAYIQRLYTLAASERDDKKGKAVDKGKQENNGSDVSNRLRSGSVNGQIKTPASEIPKGKVKLGDAIDWALKEAGKG